MPVFVKSGVTDGNKATVFWQALTPTVTASGSASGYPAINVIDPATWSSWKGNSSTLNTIVYDFGSSVSINSFGISAHNIATSGITSINLHYSDDGSSWTLIQIYTPLTDDDIVILFPEESHRYWRSAFYGPAANIGCIVWASKLAFPHAPIDSYTPLHHARTYTKEFNDSIGGAMLGNRVMATGASTDVDLGFVEKSFVDGPLRAFEAHYNKGGTFFYCGLPSGQPLDVGYCVAGSKDEIVKVEYIKAGKLANLSFGIRAYVG